MKLERIVNLKTTHGNDSVEVVRYLLQENVKIVEIQDVMSQKDDVKKRIGYAIIATPDTDEQSEAIQDYCDTLSFNVKVRVNTREMAA